MGIFHFSHGLGLLAIHLKNNIANEIDATGGWITVKTLKTGARHLVFFPSPKPEVFMRSPVFPSRFPKRVLGFGLLEIILVFAIVIGAAAVVFTVFQSAKPTSDAANEVSNYATIVGNLKTVYGINRVYAGITPERAIQAHAIPSSMVASSTQIMSQWGPVDLSSSTCVGLTDGCLQVTYSQVPVEACVKFVSGTEALVRNDFIYINNIGVSGGNDRKINYTDLIDACSKPTNTVMMVTN